MNSTTTNHLDHPALGIASALATVANLGSLYFSIWRLKVHKHVKRIFIWGTLQNSIGSIAILSGYSIMMMADPSNIFVACALFSIPLQHSLNGGYVMTSIIAVIRYYMADRTAISRRIDHSAITLGSLLATAAHTAVFTGVWISTFTTDSYWEVGTAQCMNAKFFNVITVLPPIEGMLGILLTLVFDVAMIKFIKNQAKVKPLQLAVWSSGKPEAAVPLKSHNDVMKATVPVQSTMLSTAFAVTITVLSASLLAVSKRMTHLKAAYRPIGKAFIIGMLIVQMPLMLSITVKNQNKNQRPSPPSGLQYHGPIVEEEEKAEE